MTMHLTWNVRWKFRKLGHELFKAHVVSGGEDITDALYMCTVTQFSNYGYRWGNGEHKRALCGWALIKEIHTNHDLITGRRCGLAIGTADGGACWRLNTSRTRWRRRKPCVQVLCWKQLLQRRSQLNSHVYVSPCSNIADYTHALNVHRNKN